MEKLLAYFGHHKCGSTFIVSFLARLSERLGLKIFHSHAGYVFGCDIVQYREQHDFNLWLYTNADFEQIRQVDLRGFHVIRDPRDLIVSAYFSHLYSHDLGVWGRLRAFRPYLRSLSKSDGLLAEMGFCAPFLMEMFHWDYDDPRILELRFEDLVGDPAGVLTQACAHLGLLEQAGFAAIREIADELSFSRLSGGRERGEEDPYHHYRKGVPGDWRNHFEARHIAEFERLYGPIMTKLGYERDSSWATDLSTRRSLRALAFGQRLRGRLH